MPVQRSRTHLPSSPSGQGLGLGQQQQQTESPLLDPPFMHNDLSMTVGVR